MAGRSVRISPRGPARPGAPLAVADVDGSPLWFRSGSPLRPSVEAFASAALPSSLLTDRPLELDRPVSATWLTGARAIGDVMHEWWGFHRVDPAVAAIVPDDDAAQRAPAAAPAAAPTRRVALCFSGGVDSFHALLTEPGVSVLVSALGFDIPLADRTRWRAWRRSLDAIGRNTGVRVVTVATNVRTHPFASLAPWPMSHGGALAALGHLLTPGVDELLVSASYPRAMPDARWGSHWRLDHHWSSGSLRVRHVGADLWRAEKLAAIADHQLVRDHLRVCWELTSAGLNCGTCEKCVRTQLVLARLGCLDAFTVFPRRPLGESIDRLPRLRNPDLADVYAGFAADAAPPVRAAVDRLLQRSEAP